MTKDEQFLIKLYEQAGPNGLKDRYEIGQMVGLSERAVNAIFNGLAQANFVQKVGDRQAKLLPGGVTLVLSLMEKR